MATGFEGFVPAIPQIHVSPEGEAWMVGCRCSACGAMMTGERIACASCGRRDTVAAVRLAERGKLYGYTIVHRSLPGVRTPFVEAIVDLDGGGTIKGVLEMDSAAAKPDWDMPVRVVFRDSGQKDPAGRPFLAYCFTPVESAQP